MATAPDAWMPSGTACLDAEALVARQAILDANHHVFGDELLYRAGPRDTACTVDRTVASAWTMSDAASDEGPNRLSGSRPAFINVTRALLVDRACMRLPSAAVVFEVLEDVDVDADVTLACHRLHSLGYRLALDDFTPGSSAEALLPYASFVKVDVLAWTPRELETIARRVARPGLVLVAERVESSEVYEHCRRAGYALFQGHFLQRPILPAANTLS